MEKIVDLSIFLQTKKKILLDGAMGTELEKHGLVPGGQNNLTNPEIVAEIHREYSQCGCHALTANTFAMSKLYIETHNINVKVQKVNLKGVELAKQIADKHQYVLGDIGPTGKMLEPYGNYSESDFYKTFKEQAEILVKGGVDGFIIETMFDLREALCALRACKDTASIPVIASIAFKTLANEGRTIMGNSAKDCAKTLTEAGAQVVGTNCGDLDPESMAILISEISTVTSLPIIAQPNAGKPKLINGKTKFDLAPTLFAEGITKCIKAGANIVGGCCGTTPAHIQALAKVL